MTNEGPQEGESQETVPAKHEESRPDATRQVHAEFTYQGPLPPPSYFAGYEKAVTGSADRVLAMAEEEGRHRREQESITTRANINAVTRGQVFALTISILAIGAGTYLIATGKGAGGLAIILTDLVGLVGAFILGPRRKRR